MSKKLRNYPDPMEVVEKYGADTVRFYMLNSPVVQAENLSFSEKSVAELARKNIGRLANVLEFYKLYENGIPASAASKNVLDSWIVARLQELIAESTEGYENYQVDAATRPLTDFIDDLSVWYVRRSRDRFKEEGDDKTDALATLRFVLHQLALVMAPAMPFFADYLFAAVHEDDNIESVHLAPWPTGKVKKSDTALIKEMASVRNVVTLALANRTAVGIKVRQPLAQLKVKSLDLKKSSPELLDLIKDEINVKEIVFDDKIDKEVELDTVITPELKEEGIVRELVRAAQDFRKELGLKPNDSISVWLSGSPEFIAIAEKYQAVLSSEVRAQEISHAPAPEHAVKKEVHLNGEHVVIAIVK